MKKIMIALGVVALAAGVQAASIQWTMSKISQSGSVTSGYVGYLVDASAYTSLSAAVADVLANGTSADGFVYTANATFASSSSQAKIAVNNTSWTLPKGYNPEDSISLYAIVFDGSVGEGATAKNYLTAADAAASVKISSAGKLGYSVADASKRTWAQVAPEPTSGLLLLLGMAGLALRRRRA